jgi:hypothetical protein
MIHLILGAFYFAMKVWKTKPSGARQSELSGNDAGGFPTTFNL